MSKVGFIGLGKLGLPVAEVIAERGGVRVFGYDVEEKKSHIIHVVDNMGKVVKDAELIFIAVPTPHDPRYDGRTPAADLPPRDFNYEIVRDVIQNMTPYLSPGQMVAQISTVLPGTIRTEIAGLVPRGVLYAYTPQFLAMGRPKEDFINSEFYLIGLPNNTLEERQKAYILRMIYGRVRQSSLSNVIHLTWEEAESVKIFYNTFISFKIGFVNMIQDVAQALGNMNVDNVTATLLKATRRLISPMYMTAGMGDGGTCHPRDNIALRSLVNRLDLHYDIYGMIMKAREEQAFKLAQELIAWILRPERPHIVILGKAFKPGVPFLEGSYSLLVGHYCTILGHEVSYYDHITGDEVTNSKPAVYLIGHNDPSLYKYPFVSGSIIVDPWRKCHSIPDCHIVSYGNPSNIPFYAA